MQHCKTVESVVTVTVHCFRLGLDMFRFVLGDCLPDRVVGRNPSPC
jgi:multisubunit Na+/H+ antiporter MnhF subunit